MQKNNNKIIRNWLYLNAFMVFAMAVIGAITRLTESGLSITEWKPISGAIPPLSHAEWLHVFDLYQQTPEYQKINHGMSLEEFKEIFFWEWFHRLWGRLIGLVYAIPLVIFWIKGMIPEGYKKPLVGLLILGGAQGLMGWLMVMSGLVERPSVSHFRLASHLSLAFIVYGCLLWIGYSLDNIKPKFTTFCRRRHGWTALAFTTITIIWGAFMAGKDAGLVSNTWPQMYEGTIVPTEFSNLTFETFFNNEAIIHFTHRWIAAITLIIVGTFAWRVKSLPLAAMIFIQFGLGIATIMTNVHIHTAATHQAGAFIVTALLLKEIRSLKL